MDSWETIATLEKDGPPPPCFGRREATQPNDKSLLTVDLIVRLKVGSWELGVCGVDRGCVLRETAGWAPDNDLDD